VLEVLRAQTVTADIAWPQLLALADDKRSRRGGFESRVFLKLVSVFILITEEPGVWPDQYGVPAWRVAMPW